MSDPPDSDQLEIVGLINWQHASILPTSLHFEDPLTDVEEQLNDMDESDYK